MADNVQDAHAEMSQRAKAMRLQENHLDVVHLDDPDQPLLRAVQTEETFLNAEGQLVTVRHTTQTVLSGCGHKLRSSQSIAGVCNCKKHKKTKALFCENCLSRCWGCSRVYAKQCLHGAMIAGERVHLCGKCLAKHRAGQILSILAFIGALILMDSE